jgi:hypothetical protein
MIENKSKMKGLSLKKIFLITMIVALCISALIGILVFLFGNFDEFGGTEFNLLTTTLSIGGYSLTALCCSFLYEKKTFGAIAIVGMTISLFALVYTIIEIWWPNDFYFDGKMLGTLIVLSILAAHMSLLLLIQSQKQAVNISLLLTIIFINVFAGLIIFLIIIDFGSNVFFLRLVGVSAILSALGTIVVPVLNKLYRIKK